MSRNLPRILLVACLIAIAAPLRGQTSEPPVPTPPASAPAPYSEAEAALAKWISADDAHLQAKTALQQCQSCHGRGAVEQGLNFITFSSREDTPLIGISVATADDALRAQLKLPAGGGVVVTKVVPDSPASAAGVEEHDVLLGVGDQTVGSPEDLDRILKAAKPDGPALKLRLIRSGAEIEKSVTPQGRAAAMYRIGITVAELDPTLRKQLKLDDAGVLATTVQAASAAEKAGIKPNDVVVAVDGTKVKQAPDLQRLVQQAGEKPIELKVVRGGEPLKVSVQPQKVVELTGNRTVSHGVGWLQRENLKDSKQFVVVDPSNDAGREALRRGLTLNLTGLPPAARPTDSDRLAQLTAELERLRAEIEALRADVKRQSGSPPPAPANPPR